MTIALILLDGKPALLIETPKGLAKVYRFQVREEEGVWCCDLEQEDGTEYTATCPGVGHWRCGCKAWLFAKGPDYSCKHVRAAQELRALLDALRGLPSEPKHAHNAPRVA